MIKNLMFGNLAIALPLILVFDQMLLPMFHLSGIPIKPSYLVLMAVPFITKISRANIQNLEARRRRLWKMTSPIAGIALIGFVGQVYLMTLGDVLDPYEAYKQLIVYAFMVLAFNLGQHVPQFPLRSIIWIFYGAIATILLLSIAVEYVPWFAKLWWNTDELIAERMLQNNIRPTPFGDGSMVASGILYLFIVVSVRLGYLKISKLDVVLTTSLAFITAFILASRNQMTAIGFLSMAFIIRDRTFIVRRFMFLFSCAIVMLILFNYFEDTARKSFRFIDNSYHRVETTNLLDTGGKSREGTILRPIVRWDRFVDRFIVSPIVGTGFSTLSYYPFARLNFHNDWFYIFATSGSLGGILLFLWMFRIYKALGVVVLLPFFLPGLTNSFLGHVSGVIVYCFFIGVLIERKNISSTIDLQEKTAAICA